MGILKIVNSIPVKGFGPLNQNLEGPGKSLLDYINYEIEKFEKSKVRPMITDETWERITQKLLEYGSRETSSTFVHADFRLRNFIWDEERLTFFDFSNALGLEPSFDFIRFQYVDTSERAVSLEDAQWARDEYIKHFYQGKDFEKEEDIYRLLLTLRLSPYYHRKKKRAHLKQELQRMKQWSKT